MASERILKIEKLSRRHDRSNFDCGEPHLNEYLRKFANQNIKKGISVTYVAVEPDNDTILGYYSISSGQVACDELSERERARLPRYPVPVIKIGRLASNLEVRGEGIGGMLLIDALQRAVVLSKELGVYAVEVDAKSDGAKAFYTRYGFQELKDDGFHLYMSIKTIEKFFKAT